MQAKNQNKIKNAKMFRRPISGYNVGEPFESDKWDLEYHCCWTYGISNM